MGGTTIVFALSATGCGEVTAAGAVAVASWVFNELADNDAGPSVPVNDAVLTAKGAALATAVVPPRRGGLGSCVAAAPPVACGGCGAAAACCCALAAATFAACC